MLTTQKKDAWQSHHQVLQSDQSTQNLQLGSQSLTRQGTVASFLKQSILWNYAKKKHVKRLNETLKNVIRMSMERYLKVSASLGQVSTETK